MLMVNLVNPKWGLHFYETNSDIRSSPHCWPQVWFSSATDWFSAAPHIQCLSVSYRTLFNAQQHAVGVKKLESYHSIVHSVLSRQSSNDFSFDNINFTGNDNMDSYWENNGRALGKNRCFYTQVALHQLRVRVHHFILCTSPFYYLKFGRFTSMRLAKQRAREL